MPFHIGPSDDEIRRLVAHLRNPKYWPRWRRLRRERGQRAAGRRVIMRGHRQAGLMGFRRAAIMVWPTEIGETGWSRGLDAVVDGYGPVRSFATREAT